MLPDDVELVHGPGCPVCVIPMGRVDDAIAVAETPGVIFTSFGDMMRVPGGQREPARRPRREGADVRFVYSPLDALRIAIETPTATSCSSPSGSRRPRRRRRSRCSRRASTGVTNFSVFSNHVTIVPPIKAILESPDLRLDGFLGPGHVSTVIGQRPYRFVPAQYGKPLVTAGFEPLDILQAIAMLLTQIREGRCEVENQYTPRRPRRGQPAGAGAARRGVRAAAALRVARAGLHLAERAQAARRVRRLRRRAALRRARRARRRPEGVPVRRGAEGRHQAVGVQGVRHRVHTRDADRHVHGVVGGRVRGVLQLRPAAPRGSRRRSGRPADRR